MMRTPDARLAQAGESPAAFARRCAAHLEHHLSQHHETLAALILEPLIQCATGMAMHDAEYLVHARELCDRYQVHLIADEIAVGFGRSGTFFAHEQAGIRPDFLCLSKGISGGYLPLSAVLTTDAVYHAFYSDDTARGFLHSHSYTGNALACSAALAVLDIFDEDDVLARNHKTARALTALCEPLIAHPRVEHFRNRGMIWAFDVRGAPADFARRYFLAALARGLLLRPIGNTVYFMPPYVLNPEEQRLLASGALHALESVVGAA
jgi:adenosylmethionine-8-amino-7-oxononanoate aminotransferase